jgi:hypothetical protein
MRKVLRLGLGASNTRPGCHDVTIAAERVQSFQSRNPLPPPVLPQNLPAGTCIVSAVQEQEIAR